MKLKKALCVYLTIVLFLTGCENLKSQIRGNQNTVASADQPTGDIIKSDNSGIIEKQKEKESDLKKIENNVDNPNGDNGGDNNGDNPNGDNGGDNPNGDNGGDNNGDSSQHKSSSEANGKDLRGWLWDHKGSISGIVLASAVVIGAIGFWGGQPNVCAVNYFYVPQAVQENQAQVQVPAVQENQAQVQVPAVQENQAQVQVPAVQENQAQVQVPAVQENQAQVQVPAVQENQAQVQVPAVQENQAQVQVPAVQENQAQVQVPAVQENQAQVQVPAVQGNQNPNLVYFDIHSGRYIPGNQNPNLVYFDIHSGRYIPIVRGNPNPILVVQGNLYQVQGNESPFPVLLVEENQVQVPAVQELPSQQQLQRIQNRLDQLQGQLRNLESHAIFQFQQIQVEAEALQLHNEQYIQLIGSIVDDPLYPQLNLQFQQICQILRHSHSLQLYDIGFHIFLMREILDHHLHLTARNLPDVYGPPPRWEALRVQEQLERHNQQLNQLYQQIEGRLVIEQSVLGARPDSQQRQQELREFNELAIQLQEHQRRIEALLKWLI
ncbi:hypothetical protein [Candidatus Endomicrobiellum trichonymphae]|uniref:Uncharacterized protein n=1 Tax=Endomicrobium trichonymphae TaxID=1408204 RepID=B1H0S8_ENDTX|nr:hypothetical protein [Candidatus Endomicrobium trichonymphae]BAG14255.1 hypothetical protein TGRD_P2-2 [Candidatus Endomicrobium trichonymphae]